MAEAEARVRALPLVLNMMEVADSKMTDAGNKAATNLAMILAQNKAAPGSSFDKMVDDEKVKPATGAIRIEILPEALVERLKKSPFKRPLPHRESFLERNLELAEVIMKLDAECNSLVDLQEDVVRQAEEKGYAKVGVEVMDYG